jgi:hypothetical protein
MLQSISMQTQRAQDSRCKNCRAGRLSASPCIYDVVAIVRDIQGGVAPFCTSPALWPDFSTLDPIKRPDPRQNTHVLARSSYPANGNASGILPMFHISFPRRSASGDWLRRRLLTRFQRESVKISSPHTVKDLIRVRFGGNRPEPEAAVADGIRGYRDRVDISGAGTFRIEQVHELCQTIAQ